MSCDLQFTYGGSIKFKGTTKILTVSPKLCAEMFGVEKAYVGFCGNADNWANVVGWFATPEEKMPKLSGIELLMLTSTKEIFHATTLKNWLKIDEPFFAVGSGMPFAMSAMATGMSPKDAVKFAHKFDPSTGKEVKTYTL